MKGAKPMQKLLDFLLFVVTLAAVLVSFIEDAPDWAGLMVLLLFVTLFFARLWLSDHRLNFLKRNWIDLAFIVMLSSPLLRIFIALKVAGLLPAIKIGALIRANRERLLKLVILSADSFPVAMTLLFSIVFIFGTTTYLLEHTANPSFSSIGDGLWWAFVTLTTVGYGDIVPVTAGGRVVAVITMVFGVTVYSLMIANLTFFVEQSGRRRLASVGQADEADEDKQAPSGTAD